MNRIFVNAGKGWKLYQDRVKDSELDSFMFALSRLYSSLFKAEHYSPLPRAEQLPRHDTDMVW